MTERDICDFCSDPSPVRTFDAETFIDATLDPAAESRGGWMACGPCAQMIDSEQWETLANRATDAFCRKYGVWVQRADVRVHVLKTHALFRQHRRVPQ
jgi:hypothetical protein